MFYPTSKMQETILQSDADLMVVGGAAASGKTFTSCGLVPLRYIHDPNFTCIIFRRTSVQCRGLGGTFDTLKEIYTELPKEYRPKIKEGKMLFEFPSGARIICSHLEYEKDKYSHQGLQYSLVIFDESTHFTWSQISYLQSRLRSAAEGNSRMILTTNPDPRHKLREIVDWYIGDDGRPDPERNGSLRYFVMNDGKFIWANKEETLLEYCDTSVGERPMTFQGVFGTIHDNPEVIKKNRGYLTFLKNLDYVEKERLYYGSWDVVEQGAQYFKREWLNEVDRLPHDCIRVRSYDKASSEKTKATPKPDYTATIGMAKSPHGDIYIYGNFHPDFCDKDEPDIKGRFRKLVGERDFLIERQALYDDPDQTMVILPRDSGAAGKYEFVASAQKLAAIGCTVKEDPVNPHKSKLMRATPFFSACENGYVYIVVSTFNPGTLEAYLSELESFDGTRSTSYRKDDWVDATTTAFNILMKVRAHKTVVRNQIACHTELANSGVADSRIANNNLLQP